jgi:hypothetical protein
MTAKPADRAAPRASLHDDVPEALRWKAEKANAEVAIAHYQNRAAALERSLAEARKDTAALMIQLTRLNAENSGLRHLVARLRGPRKVTA